MGTYLSTPSFEPECSSGKGKGLEYGASSVQGWRVSQEDAHNCIINYGDEQDAFFFAVYDGHGGSEVSKYCSLQLPSFIQTLSSYKSGDHEKALIEGFLKFDKTLTSESTIEALKDLAQYESSDDEEEVDEKGATETTLLNEEARMPIEDVLKHYMELKKKKAAEKDKPSGDGDKSDIKNGDVEKDEEKKIEISEEPGSSVNGESKKKTEDRPSSSATPSSSTLAGGTSNGKRAKRAAAQKAESIRLAENGLNDEEDDEDEESEVDEESEGENEEDGSDDDEDDEEEDEDDDDCEQLDSDIPGCGSGTTAVVALLKGNILTVANAGDSRAIVCRNGKAIDMSVDHKPEDAAERERIENAGGKVTSEGRVNGGLNLSRALGDHVYKQNDKLPLEKQMISPLPDVKRIELDMKTDQFMVLACDGIWNCMTSQEVCDFVTACLKQGDKLSDICVQLFRRCLAPDTSGDGTGCDNMTCIVVKFGESPTSGKRGSESSERNDDEVTPESKKSKVEPSSDD